MSVMDLLPFVLASAAIALVALELRRRHNEAERLRAMRIPVVRDEHRGDRRR